jgi:hypothetical protein
LAFTIEMGKYDKGQDRWDGTPVQDVFPPTYPEGDKPGIVRNTECRNKNPSENYNGHCSSHHLGHFLFCRAFIPGRELHLPFIPPLVVMRLRPKQLEPCEFLSAAELVSNDRDGENNPCCNKAKHELYDMKGHAGLAFGRREGSRPFLDWMPALRTLCCLL